MDLEANGKQQRTSLAIPAILRSVITALLVWQLLVAFQPTSARFDTQEAMAEFAAFTDRIFFTVVATLSFVLAIGLWLEWTWVVWLSLSTDLVVIIMLAWCRETATLVVAVPFVVDGLLLVCWLRRSRCARVS
jgi:hypothetical protein